PHAQERDRHPAMAAARDLAAALPVALPGLHDPVLAVAAQQAAGADEAYQTARGEGAAREAEHIDLVALDIVLGEEQVAGADIVVDALTGGARDQPLHAARGGTHAANVEGELRCPIPAPWHHRLRDPGDIGGGASPVRPVPGTVETQDQPL